jgi:uncharacterized phiE125 gp8 family phage protein
MPTIKFTDATTEPLLLADVKSDLKIDHSEDDALIARLIKAARLACEQKLERTLIETTWDLTVDFFPSALKLLYPRIMSVSSVKFYDEDGALQTLDPLDYTVDTVSEPGWLVPAYEKAWPDTRVMPNAVTVRYIAGYGAAASSVPEDIKLWILLHVGHFYENRQAAGAEMQLLPLWDSLLDPYRVWSL